MRRKVLAAGIGISLILFVLFPDVVTKGAKNGLLLWFEVVLPALLPFMILSALIVRLQMTSYITRIVAPVFCGMFGISKTGCYPVVIGMLSGYPLGAKTVADLYQHQQISKKEAQYILHFCNNVSPMFLLEYIGITCMGMKYPVLLLAIIYLSAWTGAWLERGIDRLGGNKRRQYAKEEIQGNFRKSEGRKSLMELLDGCILDSFITLTKVGGYIILFSILAGLLQSLVMIDMKWKAAGISLLEITTGGSVMTQCSFPGAWQHILLIAFCAFGGLSSVAQTASVIGDTDLSVGRYLLAKGRQAVIAAGYSFLLAPYI